MRRKTVFACFILFEHLEVGLVDFKDIKIPFQILPVLELSLSPHCPIRIKPESQATFNVLGTVYQPECCTQPEIIKRLTVAMTETLMLQTFFIVHIEHVPHLFTDLHINSRTERKV